MRSESAKNAKNAKNAKRIPLACFVLVLLAAGAALLLRSRAKTAAAAADTGEPTPAYSGAEQSPSIAIPGYGSITLQAGQTEQSVSFDNPAQNTCYFRLSLILPDGTAVWQSDLLAPGEAYESITLSRSLAAGDYPGTILKYDCYSLADHSQLNGAEIEVNLIVK